MHAIRILTDRISSQLGKDPHDSLFWVVRRVGEYSRIETSLDSITACDYNAVFIGIKELVIE